MKNIWLYMLVLLLSVVGLCIWDSIHTEQVFNKMQTEADAIYTKVLTTEISNEDLANQIQDLDIYWTKKMDTLCISISRKDLQPVSDYLQYLCASIKNESQEDAITYSRLLNYNIIALVNIFSAIF